MMSGQNLLEMKHIQKSFNSTPVLKNVDFSVEAGEIHSLMGENGAGKSTLIKILTGIYPKDGGEIYFEGKQVIINSKADAAKLGISVIYQELSLIPTLNVVQNIMLGKEKIKAGFLNYREMKKEVVELIRQYGFDIDPEARVETLTIAQRQIIEILKALSDKSKLIIMDEPTASLSAKESDTLFKIIRQLKEAGVGIIYISHRLEEVYQLSDRLTVLRDGVAVAVLKHEEIVPEEVVRLMIGKTLSESKKSKELTTYTTPTILKISNLTRKGIFHNISFEIHAGEIIGLAGLVGSGRTELVRCIYGADKFDSGEVEYLGTKIHSEINANIRKGIGFVPEDRKTQGFIPLLSIEKNIALPNYDKLAKKGVVNHRKERQLGINMTSQLNIKPADSQIPVGNLSGGNQQKAVLAKCLCRDMKLLIIDEPTAGIDIGAKDAIYGILEDLAKNQTAVIMVSSDLQELVRVSTRIIVMRKGEIFTEFNQGQVTQDDILMAESGILRKEVTEA